jgi:hypothetical protein
MLSSCISEIHSDKNLISLEEITRLNAEPETTSTITRRIDELKTQHAKDMESLYAYYAQVYRQEQEDLRISSDNSVSQEQDDPALLTELAALTVSLFVTANWSFLNEFDPGIVQDQSTANKISAGVR